MSAEQENRHNKEKESNKLGLSIAVLLSVVGLILLWGGTTIGCILMGWSLTLSILSGVAVAVLAGAGVFIGAMAKSETGDIKKWAKAKQTCIIVLIVALICGLYPTIVAFNFLTGVQELRSKAIADEQALEGQLNEFLVQEKRRVNLTFDGLSNAASIGNPKLSQELIEFLQAEALYYADGGTIDATGIESQRNAHLRKVERIELDGVALKEDKFDADLNQLRNIIEGVDPTVFASLAWRIDRIANEHDSILSRFSQDMIMPEVKCGGDLDRFDIGENSARVYDIEPVNYEDAYSIVTHLTCIGVIGALFVALLVLCHFLLTAPSLRKAVDTGAKASDKYGLTI